MSVWKKSHTGDTLEALLAWSNQDQHPACCKHCISWLAYSLPGWGRTQASPEAPPALRSTVQPFSENSVQREEQLKQEAGFLEQSRKRSHCFSHVYAL